VSPRRGITPSSDTTRDIPAHPGSRLDRIETAIVSLREEERRLQRIGLTGPARTCRQQIRYWEFIGSLFAITHSPSPRLRKTGRPGLRLPTDR
jgi:hypothetical protein